MMLVISDPSNLLTSPTLGWGEKWRIGIEPNKTSGSDYSELTINQREGLFKQLHSYLEKQDLSLWGD